MDLELTGNKLITGTESDSKLIHMLKLTKRNFIISMKNTLKKTVKKLDTTYVMMKNYRICKAFLKTCGNSKRNF